MSTILDQVEGLLGSGSGGSSATIDTPLGADVKFHSMGGIEGLSRPFAYEVDVVSDRSDIQPSELLGQSVTVHLTLADDEDPRHWNGLVTGLQYIDTSDDGDSRYRLTVRPWFWQLTRCADCRIFQQMTIPEIVMKVFDDRGFTDYDRSLFEEYEQHEYVVQYRETDFQFVSRLLEREGIYYFFRHEDGKHTLVLVDSAQAHQAAAGCEQMPYAPDDDHRDATTEYVRQWKAEAQLETGVYGQGDFDFTKPQVKLFAQATASDEDAASAANLQVYDYPGGFDNFADADAYARLRLEQARRDAQRWTGETNARAMTVGATFELTDHPRDDQNQSYLVTSARYRLKGQDERSSDDDDDPFTCSLVAIGADVTFRPPLSTRKPVVRGPQTAIVVGPGGQEIWTDQYGRIKVQFPWDRLGRNDESSSCWIRVSQAWAGGSFGAQFIPRIGHEVIVDFLEGDPDRPIVTGCVYNGSNMPTFDLPGNQTQSGFRTQSTPGGSANGGNEIRFEDATGAEDLYIHAERTQTTLVENAQSITVGGDRALSVTGSEVVSVLAGRSTTVTISDATTVAGFSTLTVAGDRTEQVAGERNVQVTGDETDTFRGSLMVAVTGNESVQVSGNASRSVAGSADASIDGRYSASFGDDFTTRHAGHTTVIVGGPTATASASVHIEGSGRLYAAEAFDGIAVKSFTITCGQSVITLAPDSITIASPTINLVTKDAEIQSDKVNVAASGAITIGGDKVTATSSGASVALDSNATVQGAKVQLKGGSGSSAQNSTTSKTTTITVNDSSGKPLANQRVILRTGGDGGDESSVVLDATGSIAVAGDGPFDIVLPDLPDAKAS
jgi:type VI secretion system secreted protein VgrG